MSQGLAFRTNDDVGAQLADVVIAAAILARQLGVDLDTAGRGEAGQPELAGPALTRSETPCTNVSNVGVSRPDRREQGANERD